MRRKQDHVASAEDWAVSETGVILVRLKRRSFAKCVLLSPSLFLQYYRLSRRAKIAAFPSIKSAWLLTASFLDFAHKDTSRDS